MLFMDRTYLLESPPDELKKLGAIYSAKETRLVLLSKFKPGAPEYLLVEHDVISNRLEWLYVIAAHEAGKAHEIKPIDEGQALHLQNRYQRAGTQPTEWVEIHYALRSQPFSLTLYRKPEGLALVTLPESSTLQASDFAGLLAISREVTGDNRFTPEAIAKGLYIRAVAPVENMRDSAKSADGNDSPERQPAVR
jgi:hypothetical protein